MICNSYLSAFNVLWLIINGASIKIESIVFQFRLLKYSIHLEEALDLNIYEEFLLLEMEFL